ncbi:hypothetical protein QWZ13_11950 [Reinekea marina]|uniref:hypothetical protein n=1 Tax=Reinekea marina TaxID=1310421 RepID=UPI0025B5FF8B|nr:hypothetical protein [Reinekea marina]MDN3649629.1 hypothetical protein [Reinekea marina]
MIYLGLPQYSGRLVTVLRFTWRKKTHTFQIHWHCHYCRYATLLCTRIWLFHCL